jgi:hypothetical protein
MNEQGQIVLRKRLSRHDLMPFIATLPCGAKKLKYPFSPVVLVSPPRVSLLDFTFATSHSL